MDFQAQENKTSLIRWIRDRFENTSSGRNAVIGISGSADSAVYSALCAEALGKERVIGVLMPNGSQPNMPDSYQLVQHLDIPSMIINISGAVEAIHRQLSESDIASTAETDQQLLAGIRWAVLHAVAQATNGRVFHCRERNQSAAAGTAIPESFTSQEITALGRELGLPENLI